MKLDFNRKYNTIAAYVLIIAAILISYILVIIYWDNISNIFASFLETVSPFLYGFAIAYILNPIYKRCELFYKEMFCQKKKHNKKVIKVVSLLLTYIIAILFLALFFYIIIPQLWQSFENLVGRFPGYIDAVEDMLEIRFADIPFLSERLLGDVKTHEGGLVEWLETVYSTITAYTPKLISFITGLATHIWNFVLGFIISVYMLSDKERFSIQFKKLTFALFKKDRAETLISGVKKAHMTFGGFLSGKIVDSLIIGCLCFVGMSVLKIPYTPLVSVVVGVTNVIPYFGPFLGAIPSIFIILLEEPVKALWFAIFILVLQQIDGNFIGPKIIGEKIGLSSFWVIFALLIMSSMLGVLGLLLAVPIFALIYDLIKFLCNRSLEKKGIVSEVCDYGDVKQPEIAKPEDENAQEE